MQTGPRMTVTALGVGHGDATLLQFVDPSVDASWTCLVDGGQSPERLIQRLEANGVEKIDLLVLTHADQDHVGGLLGLAGKYSVAEYWGPALPAFRRHAWLFGSRAVDVLERCGSLEKAMGAEVLYPLEGYTSEPCGDAGPRVHVLSPATRLVRRLLTETDVSSLFTSSPMPLGWLTQPEEGSFEQSADFDALDDALRTGALTPSAIPSSFHGPVSGDEGERRGLVEEWAATNKRDAEFFGDPVLNNTSLVLWIEVPVGARRHSILLTGDQENWTYLLFRHPRGLQTDVYKASHHGGRVYLEANEAHEEVMAAIRPRVVLMSACGQYDLPRNTTRDAAMRSGASVVCTSSRKHDTILGLLPPVVSCHERHGCGGKTRDAGIVLDAEGIRANVRACHTGMGREFGPAIQVTQHLLQPSPIVGQLFEQELRRSVISCSVRRKVMLIADRVCRTT